MDPQALYVQLGRIIESAPQLVRLAQYGVDQLQWLGRANALVAAVGDLRDETSFRTASIHANGAVTTAGQELFAKKIMAILYRALATAELRAPAAAQGAFIPAGNSFDAMVAIGKVLGPATRDALIIDPYMDEKALTDFAPLAPEHVTIRLLSDQQGVKPTLGPAATRWAAQYKTSRPLEAKLAAATTLHDRLIMIDGVTVWVLTQSLNAFAARAPASVVRVDDELAKLKIAAYQVIWGQATPL